MLNRRCPECGEPVPDADDFCGACGAKIVYTCPACMTAIKPGVRFCPGCGAEYATAKPKSAKLFGLPTATTMTLLAVIGVGLIFLGLTRMVGSCMSVFR